MPQNQALHEAKKRIRELEKEIAESRKAIDGVMREKLFSEKVLDSLSGIFYLYNEAGDLIQWNKNHETLTGYSAEELPRRSMQEWFSGKDRQRVLEVVKKLFEDGRRREVEADLIIKSGQRISYYFTGVRMNLSGRKYLLGVGIDLTEQKITEF